MLVQSAIGQGLDQLVVRLHRHATSCVTRASSRSRVGWKNCASLMSPTAMVAASWVMYSSIMCKTLAIGIIFTCAHAPMRVSRDTLEHLITACTCTRHCVTMRPGLIRVHLRHLHVYWTCYDYETAAFSSILPRGPHRRK